MVYFQKTCCRILEAWYKSGLTYRSAAPRIPKLRTVERWNKNERTRDKETLMITARLLKSENAAIEKKSDDS